jgi:hypothetical protein
VPVSNENKRASPKARPLLPIGAKAPFFIGRFEAPC